jgi:hypothetical protein
MSRFSAWSWPAIAAVLGAGVWAADRESTGGVEVIARTVAVKDVSAWPNLTLLADGSVVATIFNQPCHGIWEGDVECWATSDAGATWERRGTPAPHEPTTNRMNVAAGTNSRGELVVLASGWSHKPPPPPDRKPDGKPVKHGPPAEILPIWVCRSADGGRTWTRAEGVEPPSQSRLAAESGLTLSDRVVPFGDVIRIGSGRLAACLYAENKLTEGHDSLFFTSGDDGSTWQLTAVISRGDANETAALKLPGGDLLACARTAKDQHLELFRSTDDGKHWAWELGLSRGLQIPAHLLVLADGRLLLTYGDRTGGWERPAEGGASGATPPDLSRTPHGILFRTSADGGRSWTAPLRIAGFDHDGGYPATVELADGRLLTAYYARRTPRHDGYHMETVLWRPPR